MDRPQRSASPPLALPAPAPGTVEFRSLLEPIRNSNPYVTYFEATCDSIDPVNKVRPGCGTRVC